MEESRSRIKESVFCNSKERFYTLKPQKHEQDTDKIPMADKQFLGADAFETLKKSLENMCTLSQQQLNLLNETKQDLDPKQECAGESVLELNLTCEDEEVKVNEDHDQPQEEEDEENAEGITHLIERERVYLPDPHYLENRQKDITWNMRAILIDWMMEVSSEFHLKRETFYLSVYYLDSHLSKTQVHKSALQLLGLTSLFMASKMEEVYPRKVSDFARAADHGYTIEQILDMELNILRVTKWLINPPTLSMWSNWYMSQWDIFTKQKAQHWGKFKQSSEDSYQCKSSPDNIPKCSKCSLSSSTPPSWTSKHSSTSPGPSWPPSSTSSSPSKAPSSPPKPSGK